MSELLDVILKEVEAREISDNVKTHDADKGNILPRNRTPTSTV